MIINIISYIVIDIENDSKVQDYIYCDVHRYNILIYNVVLYCHVQIFSLDIIDKITPNIMCKV